MTADEPDAPEPDAGPEPAGDEPDAGADPASGSEPDQVRADPSPASDDPDPDSGPDPEPNPYEGGPDAAEPGLMGLLFRAGDRLAYQGDLWEARVRDDHTRAPTPPPPPVFVGTFHLGGNEVPWNMHDWSPTERRGASLLAAALASFLVVVGILAQFVAPGATWFLTLLLVGVVVTFAFQLAVFLTAEEAAAPGREPAPAGATAAGAGAGAATRETAWEEPDEEAADAAPADGDEPLDVLTLKCSDCGEVFDVEDHGERPLTHTCPGCGADGEIPASELPDPADLRDDDADEADDGESEPEAPAGEIPQETGDPIPEFELDDEDDRD